MKRTTRAPLTEAEHRMVARRLERSRDELLELQGAIIGSGIKGDRLRKTAATIRAVQRLRLALDGEWFADPERASKPSPYLT